VSLAARKSWGKGRRESCFDYSFGVSSEGQENPGRNGGWLWDFIEGYVGKLESFLGLFCNYKRE
jgi:hypothetical protein